MTREDLLEAQQALEDESRALGIARYRQQRSKWTSVLGKGVDEADLPPGRRLLRLALQPTVSAIDGFLDAAQRGVAGRKHSAIKLLKGAEPEPLAVLTLRSAIQSGVQRLVWQKAAVAVASAVMGHMEAEALRKVNKAGAAGLDRSLRKTASPSQRRLRLTREIYRQEGVALDWSPRDRVLVGSKLIELAMDATGLFTKVRVDEGMGKKRRTHYRLELTDKAGEWLEEQHARCELLDPIPMPMVVPPCPWTTPFDGGYLDPPPGNAIIRQHSRPYFDELENIEMPLVFSAINAIQGTAWKTNRPILQAMRAVWESGGTLGGLPPRDDELVPARPSGFEEDEAIRQEWKSRAAKVHAVNARRKGKRLALMQKLWVAEKLADYPAVYYPHSMDWRGRVYPIPAGGPSPQGDDISKALLTFAVGEPLGPRGARWLAIHLANLFGVDKVSFEDRVRWVETHDAEIVDSATNPLNGQRFWSTADKPWQALAACIEWAGYRREGESFCSHVPIALDGSNSGLQHFTALLRDPYAAPHVNLVDQERPGDLYSVVAARAQELVNDSDDPGALPWKGQTITRKIVKRPCMTYTYSATRHSMAEQIDEVLQELDEEALLRGHEPHLGSFDNREAAFWLAGLLYSELGKQVPAARKAMDWLRKVMSLVNKLDLPIWWDTPVGLPVLQRYPREKARSVEVTIQGKTHQLRVAGEDGNPTLADFLADNKGRWNDARAALSGIAPNFIHSLDAAHLMMVANECSVQGIQSLAVIHDSFGTHAAKTDDLAAILRETFIDLYEGDPLAAFRSSVLDDLKHAPEIAKQIPEAPKKGDLDLGSIRQATYMFA
ncbi:DNA-directed RNA polymerase [Erythrobacter sp. GH1-10]|uniref:DNA-directed RNA polymerase n=1 Tax=Erythrobacter sp. GH1-10 TaxID=3349334 RepID=UPI00387815FE